MPRKIRQLKQDLRQAGAYLVSERGDHEKWRHPLLPGEHIELAGADGDDAKPYQEKQVRDFLHRVMRAREHGGRP